MGGWGGWYVNLSPGGWSPREEKQEREPPVLRPAPRTRERERFLLTQTSVARPLHLAI